MREDALERIFGIPLHPMEGHEAPPPTHLPMTEEALGITEDRLAELPIDALTDFPMDVFHAYTDDDLEKLRLNIMQRGLIHPIVVRRFGEGYQIISGHNRRTACKRAGYVTTQCIIRCLDDDAALLQYLDANVNERSGLLPSEKGRAFRMRLEVMNRQGMRTDLASPHGASKFNRSDDELGAMYGISGDTVRRYIQLTNLIAPLLNLVDEKQIPITVAAELSHLSTKNQAAVHQFCFCDYSYTITQHITDQLRARGDSVELTEAELQAIFSPAIKPLRTIPVPMKTLRAYLPPSASKTEMQRIIIEAVKFYYTQKEKET